MVTEFVAEHRPLDKYAEDLCCNSICRRNELRRSEALLELARQLHRVVTAFVHMHVEADLFHFDVKPDNLLISKDNRIYVTDLGFARDCTRYRPQEIVEVGFTFKYSHPRLHDVNQGAVVTRVPEKAKNKLLGQELHPRFDIFAFGRTLQEVLKRIELYYGEGVYSEYTFNYLHIIACLCLDGWNGASLTEETFVSDQALGMPLHLFARHKFSSFTEMALAFERLLRLRSPEAEVPELDLWAASTINVSDLGVTTLTPRVKALIEHPSIYRLTRELQLGFLETVFPTATHTRFQHSLGVYHAVREYILSLYYDPENPTFRVLFDPRDCRTALVATLLHDLGHTTFGHDLEEVDEKEFSHTEVGQAVLKRVDETDSRGRTLSQLVEGDESDCWGLRIDKLRSLISGGMEKPVYGVYRDMLDGQLDADKLDYLVRDSVESRVKYGHGLDYARFLRSLTTIARLEDKTPTLRLAVKQKGAASAEAFAFARYQLYQALYWHHTFRAVKAMLLTSVAATIKSLRQHPPGDLFEVTPLRSAYVDFVIKGMMPEVPKLKPGQRKSGRRLTPIDEEIAGRLRDAAIPPAGGSGSNDRTLLFFWKLGSDRERRLVEDLMSRRYYKRLIEVLLEAFRDPVRLRDLFVADRVRFQERLETVLIKSLVRTIQDAIPVRASLVEDETLKVLQEVKGERYVFVADLPLRGWTSGGSSPSFVSDYKRKYFRVDVARDLQVGGETLWTHQLGEMMRRIAVFRVFCEPSVHDIVRRVWQPSVVLKTLREEFPEME